MFNQELRDFYRRPQRLASIPSILRLIDSLGIKNHFRLEVIGKLIPACDSLLDVACGNGQLIFRYGAKKAKKCLGIDISPFLIEKARKKLSQKKDINFILADFMDFKTKEKYDVVVASAFLEHVVFPLRTLRKINQILKPAGCLILEVPNIGYLLHRLALLFGKFPETAPTLSNIPGVAEEHLRFFTLASLKKSLALTGFEVKVVTNSGRLPFLRKIFPSLLAADLVVKALKVRPVKILSKEMV